MGQKTIASGTVADAYLALLADRGVEYFFANAGTDFAPIIESFSKAQANGTPIPKPVLVPHENVALHMAMGYYLKTGRPQVVMVHVNVGTANAMCGLMNASRAGIPVLFSAGRTPFSEEGGLPGARTGEIHWPQEMRDQAAMLREFVKWDYSLPNAQVVESTVDRALNLMQAEPKGPVYLTLPREVLAAPIKDFTYSSPGRHAIPSAPFPDTNAIDRAAELIAAAENPLIITAQCGRDEGDVARLAALVDRFAIPVVQRKNRYMSLPSDHPMHLGYAPEPFFDAADLIIVLDCDVPWIPNKKAPKPDTKVIHIGPDPIFANYPMRGFPADLAITGILSAALPLLDQALATREKGAKDRIDARRKRLVTRRAEQREKWRAVLEKSKGDMPLNPTWITHCIDQVKDKNAIVIKEGPITQEHISFSEPGTYFFVGAAGALGWGLGTSLGIKAAVPDRQVICTVGDGAYMFGNPVPSHYVSKAENLPILTLVFNNEMWGAVKRNTREVYPDGFAAKSNREPLTYFESGTRFEKAVEVADGYGEQVNSAADLPKALDRALNAMAKNNCQALLNIICRGP